MDLLRHIKQNGIRRALFAPGDRLLLAVSGGVDSMVMLSLLHHVAAKVEMQLSVAHFNHCLRGKESDDDAEFTRNAVEKLRLPFYLGQGNVREFQKRAGVSLEMAARQLRHEFLAQTARASGQTKIVTAHHADDQLELFFLRLFRGAGVDGLGGMDWTSSSPVDPKICIVRPLLDISKREIEAFAKKLDISYRVDASNEDTDILRNRVRVQLLPSLAENFTLTLPQTVARIMDALRAEGDVVEKMAQEWLGSKTGVPWDTLSVAVRRRCVARQMYQLNLPPDFDLIESLCGVEPAMANGAQGIRLQQDGKGHISLLPLCTPIKNGPPLAVDIQGKTGEIPFGAWRIKWRREPRKAKMGILQQPGIEHFDAQKVGSRLTIGNWRPGDRFQPIGMSKPVKLQDLFVNLKIKRDQKHLLLVARTETGEIFWVQGLRIGDAYKLDNNTAEVLTWEWHPRDA